MRVDIVGIGSGVSDNTYLDAIVRWMSVPGSTIADVSTKLRELGARPQRTRIVGYSLGSMDGAVLIGMGCATRATLFAMPQPGVDLLERALDGFTKRNLLQWLPASLRSFASVPDAGLLSQLRIEVIQGAKDPLVNGRITRLMDTRPALERLQRRYPRQLSVRWVASPFPGSGHANHSREAYMHAAPQTVIE